MRLRIEKLGRIKEAEIEIRPLTVFVGQNSVNKTWAAYALYGLLRNLTWRTSALLGVRSMGTSLIKIQTDAVRKQVLSEAIGAVTRLPLEGEADTVEMEVSRNRLLGALKDKTAFTLVSDHLRKLLQLDDELAPESRVTLEVDAEELRRREATVSMQLSYPQESLRMLWIKGEPEVSLSVQLSSDAGALRERAAKLLRAFAQRFLSMGMVLLLPAERKTLASTYKQTSDDGQIEEVLSQPVFAYVTFLKSVEAVWRKRQGAAMASAVGYLDDRILGGSIQFQEMGAGQRLVFVPHKGPALPMHATSSMVRSLAGLDLYLRYGAREGDTLIIDEPEMNAHPDAQVALVELLATLVNKGIRIVLTTHSPYIIDHINNLIWAKKLSEADQGEAAKAFKLGTTESFLRPEDVAAYLFEAETEEAPVTVKSIFDQGDPEGLIDWETFSRTSRYLGNLYASEILSRLYREE